MLNNLSQLRLEVGGRQSMHKDSSGNTLVLSHAAPRTGFARPDP
jgi:hypothetical protein